MEKCLYGGNASKANRTNYHTGLLHHQLAFYIVMVSKKFIPQMCILFYNQLWDWDGRMGGLGREGLFTITSDGKLQKTSICPL